MLNSVSQYIIETCTFICATIVLFLFPHLSFLESIFAILFILISYFSQIYINRYSRKFAKLLELEKILGNRYNYYLKYIFYYFFKFMPFLLIVFNVTFLFKILPASIIIILPYMSYSLIVYGILQLLNIVVAIKKIYSFNVLQYNVAKLVPDQIEKFHKMEITKNLIYLIHDCHLKLTNEVCNYYQNYKQAFIGENLKINKQIIQAMFRTKYLEKLIKFYINVYYSFYYQHRYIKITSKNRSVDFHAHFNFYSQDIKNFLENYEDLLFISYHIFFYISLEENNIFYNTAYFSSQLLEETEALIIWEEGRLLFPINFSNIVLDFIKNKDLQQVGLVKLSTIYNIKQLVFLINKCKEDNILFSSVNSMVLQKIIDILCKIDMPDNCLSTVLKCIYYTSSDPYFLEYHLDLSKSTRRYWNTFFLKNQALDPNVLEKALDLILPSGANSFVMSESFINYTIIIPLLLFSKEQMYKILKFLNNNYLSLSKCLILRPLENKENKYINYLPLFILLQQGYFQKNNYKIMRYLLELKEDTQKFNEKYIKPKIRSLSFKRIMQKNSLKLLKALWDSFEFNNMQEIRKYPNLEKPPKNIQSIQAIMEHFNSDKSNYFHCIFKTIILLFAERYKEYSLLLPYLWNIKDAIKLMRVMQRQCQDQRNSQYLLEMLREIEQIFTKHLKNLEIKIAAFENISALEKENIFNWIQKSEELLENPKIDVLLKDFFDNIIVEIEEPIVTNISQYILDPIKALNTYILDSYPLLDKLIFELLAEKNPKIWNRKMFFLSLKTNEKIQREYQIYKHQNLDRVHYPNTKNSLCLFPKLRKNNNMIPSITKKVNNTNKMC